MIIGDARVEIQYLVTFDAEEVEAMRATGAVPPDYDHAVEMWLTAEQIAHVCITYGWPKPTAPLAHVASVTLLHPRKGDA